MRYRRQAIIAGILVPATVLALLPATAATNSTGPLERGRHHVTAFTGTVMSTEGNNILVRLTPGNGWVWHRR